MTMKDITPTTQVTAVINIDINVRDRYNGHTVNINGHNVYLSPNVVKYIHKSIDSGLTLQLVGRRIVDKCRPFIHHHILYRSEFSHADRKDMREFCRKAAGVRTFKEIFFDFSFTLIGYWACVVYDETK